jgi:hypothetical protein
MVSDLRQALAQRQFKITLKKDGGAGKDTAHKTPLCVMCHADMNARSANTRTVAAVHATGGALSSRTGWSLM